MADTGPIRAFLSYAHEDHGWRDRLLQHIGWLRNSGRLEHFDDRQIKPGEAWDPRIQDELRGADIVILLISPSFVGSAYCTLNELTAAAERDRRGEARLVPILCEHVHLGGLPIGRLQCLPQDERNDLKPLTAWSNPNEPLAKIAEHIGRIVGEIESSRATAPVDPEARTQREEVAAWRLPRPPSRCSGDGTRPSGWRPRCCAIPRTR